MTKSVAENTSDLKVIGSKP